MGGLPCHSHIKVPRCSTILSPTGVILLLPHFISVAGAPTVDGGNKRCLGPFTRPAAAFPSPAALSASQLCCISSVFLLGPLGTTVNRKH